MLVLLQHPQGLRVVRPLRQGGPAIPLHWLDLLQQRLPRHGLGRWELESSVAAPRSVSVQRRSRRCESPAVLVMAGEWARVPPTLPRVRRDHPEGPLARNSTAGGLGAHLPSLRASWY